MIAGSNGYDVDGLHAFGGVDQGTWGNIGSSQDSNAQCVLFVQQNTINFLSAAIVEMGVLERREGIYVTGSLETVTLGLAIRMRANNPGDDVEVMVAEYFGVGVDGTK